MATEMKDIEERSAQESPSLLVQTVTMVLL